MKLPSEKAFAYKMKFDALKRQGARSDLTSEQVAPKLSTEIIAEQENTSKDTIKRYIRLTKLIKPLLDLVDEGKIALMPAEKLYFLKEEEQRALAELIQDKSAEYKPRSYLPKYEIEAIVRAFFPAVAAFFETEEGNREHVWPKSLGCFGESGAGADLHHIRPAEQKVNSTRNNCVYGNEPGTSDTIKPANLSGVVGGERGGEYDYFEPLDNVKGDVARICLYVYVRYGANVEVEKLSLCADITNVFESVSVLLQWCALDPVDEWEMSRNDVVEYAQGNRNVFIDYPEYAWLIFNETPPENIKTPTSDDRNTDTTDMPHNHTYTYTVSGTGHIGLCICGETTLVLSHTYNASGTCIKCGAAKPEQPIPPVGDSAVEAFEEAVAALTAVEEESLSEQYEALYSVAIAFAEIQNQNAAKESDAYKAYILFVNTYNQKVFSTTADLKKVTYRP